MTGGLAPRDRLRELDQSMSRATKITLQRRSLFPSQCSGIARAVAVLPLAMYVATAGGLTGRRG
jgi:hypothetical protein